MVHLRRWFLPICSICSFVLLLPLFAPAGFIAVGLAIIGSIGFLWFVLRHRSKEYQ